MKHIYDINNNNNHIDMVPKNLCLWVDKFAARSHIITELQQLLKEYNKLSGVSSQQYVYSFIQLMVKFDQAAHKLNLLQEDIEFIAYDNYIYEIIRYHRAESWLETDLTDIEANLSGDGDLPYYGLVPRSQVCLTNIRAPLQGLSFLGAMPTITSKTQLMINYCIQIIIGIIKCNKFTVEKVAEYMKTYYNGNNVNISGCEDYLGFWCIRLCNLIEMGISGFGDTTSEQVFLQIDRLHYQAPDVSSELVAQYSHKVFSGELFTQRYLNKYPWLQQSFDNPCDYFTPFNTDPGVWILFANVPNTAKYQQLLEIRAGVKQAYELMLTYPGELQSDISGKCERWTYYNTPRFLQPMVNHDNSFIIFSFSIQEKEDLEKRDMENKQELQLLYQQDPVFKQLCDIYIQVFAHPFMLLDEVYHKIRHQRSELLGGEKYEDVNMYEQLIKEYKILNERYGKTWNKA